MLKSEFVSPAHRALRHRVVSPTGNLMHDIGVYGKETSCYMQAVTALATVRNNVCYNGPRAGVSLNDGFFGGTVMEGNVIFNMV